MIVTGLFQSFIVLESFSSCVFGSVDDSLGLWICFRLIVILCLL